MKIARNLHTFSEPEQKRNEILISHHGRGGGNIDSQCKISVEADDNLYNCLDSNDCKCADTRNNTFICKRYLDDEESKVLCRFEDEENFVEYYDLIKDPYQLYNIPQEELSAKERTWMKLTLEELGKLTEVSKRNYEHFSIT